MATSVLDNMKRTTQATIDGYRKFEIDAIMAPRADDCVYEALPKSMGAPALDNESYREFFSTQVIPLFEDFKVVVDSLIYDAEARKSVLYGRSTAISPVGPYDMELCLILSFNEMGEKVVRMQEMFDSATYTSFMAKVKQYAEAQGGEAQR
ncbi:hypothetical protein LTR37_020179 [Vermiconidia calcicola]|uniref:Uncharacterized protein n=1 Tax=Vermiconidia calcicola TaxID=1690605 RepID=A0ACC3MD77_9PEZI|nr:hypothetical protein LTR37_020179 [Vermiconidia calcicola]